MLESLFTLFLTSFPKIIGNACASTIKCSAGTTSYSGFALCATQGEIGPAPPPPPAPRSMLLLQGAGSDATYSNQWAYWYNKSPKTQYVTSGNGKREEFDSWPIESIKLSDASGRQVEYTLTETYSGRMSLLGIIRHCLKSTLEADDDYGYGRRFARSNLQRENRGGHRGYNDYTGDYDEGPGGDGYDEDTGGDGYNGDSHGETITPPQNSGSSAWTNGFCNIGIRKSYQGSFASTPYQYLRLFVGDGSVDAEDYALFYPFSGNGNGDFNG